MRNMMVVLAVIAVAACDRSRPELEKTLAQVQQISSEKDTLLKDVMETSQFIADLNIEMSKARSRNVGKPKQGGAGELENNLTPAQQREAIKVRVAELTARLNESESRLDASRKRVADLVANNSTLGKQLTAYDSTIAAFKKIIDNQKSEITSLTEQINALQAENVTLKQEKATLETQKVALADEAESLTAERNTVYWVVGTRAELVKKHVIDQSGGFMGFGKTPVPSRELNPRDFTPLDKSQVRDIAFPKSNKTYRIITRQDVSALETPPNKEGLIKGGIRIKDAEKFWTASKFLIIVEQ